MEALDCIHLIGRYTSTHKLIRIYTFVYIPEIVIIFYCIYLSMHICIISINRDVCVSGGDGTYLEAASIIPGKVSGEPSGPWLFGVNTDPARSEGRLCVKSPFNTAVKSDKKHHLQQQQPQQHQYKHQHDQTSPPVGSSLVFETPRVPGPDPPPSLGPPEGAPETGFDAKGYVAATLRHLLQGGARLIARQRIRATLRFPSHMRHEVTARIQQQQEEARAQRGPPMEGLGPPLGAAVGGPTGGTLSSSFGSVGSLGGTQGGGPQVEGPQRSSSKEVLTFDAGSPVPAKDVASGEVVEMGLPFLAVNDVLVSEVNVAKTLYADVWIDGEARRHKSSGILVSTGELGSTSSKHTSHW